ncbi:MAG: cyanophycin synthetase, partial [Patescibacteria group bacterium]
FGFNADADVRASDFALVRAQPVGRKKGMPVGMRATITVEGESAPVEIAGTVGTHSFLSGVAAAAVGHTLGLPLQTILEGLAGYEPPPGRMRLLPGLKGSLIIDDTYNSSPAAVEAALETLTLINPKRAIVVLGDMLELGRHSVDAHRKAGAQAAKVCDLLVTIGFRARDIAQGALDNRLRDEKIFQYEDARKAGADLKNWVGEGDVVLVKGSQSMRMERVVEELMLEPERARELLVRQDAEWKRR